MKPTRKETLQFRLDLEKDQVDKYLQDIKTVLGEDPAHLESGDCLKLTYSVSIGYFREVNNRLKALNRILHHPEVVLHVSTKELEHDFCLIQDVFRQIEKLRRRKNGPT